MAGKNGIHIVFFLRENNFVAGKSRIHTIFFLRESNFVAGKNSSGQPQIVAIS